MEDYISTFRPFSKKEDYTVTKEESDEEEEGFSDSSDEEDEMDGFLSEATMTDKDASLIMENYRTIVGDDLDDKIDDPRILRAKQIDEQKKVNKKHFEQQMSMFRKFCYRTASNNWFNNIILVIVILQVSTFLIQTNQSLSDKVQYYLTAFDQVCLGIYVFEAIVKIIGFHESYFYDNWNKLDFVLVVLSFMDYITALSSTAFSPTSIRVFRVFRTFRALRAIKLLRNRHFASLLALLNSVAKSFEDCFWSIALLLIIMYFYSFVGLTLYREVSPGNFGDFASTFFTMFQLCTFDDWYDVYDGVRSIQKGTIFFFFTFIIIGSFIVMNYITAILTDNACQAAVDTNEMKTWIKKLVKRQRSNQENEELNNTTNNKKNHSSGKGAPQLREKYPELNNVRLNDISQVLAIFGELERTQLVSNGHKAVFGELIDQALKNE
ncbi:Cation channel sperm-associated protein 1 [Tritrichomonas musculus]|uniref:Cation channel sperm-associated protein 1 n=1 Tax=Tritrichomonas musculus TaxID=1915356 RepID=A0ABR2K2I0_9EUKA